MLNKIKKILLALAALACLQSTTLNTKAEETLTQDISAVYAIVMDRDTSQILSQKNADEKMYPASMTKLMTAIIAIENFTDLNQTITITQEMLAGLAEAGASVAGFQIGDTPTIQDILYGIALPSGADATNAAAYTLCGSIEGYVEKMNEKAQSIGMTNTHFANTTGLHDENHYSTAHDIALLLQYCLNNETFSTIFSSHDYTTSPLASHPNGILLESTLFKAASINNYAIPGLIGGKTGFTYPAGRCLASWEDVQNMHLITVVADADAYDPYSPHIRDTDTILNALQTWTKQAILTKDNIIKTISVTHPFAETDTIQVKAPDDFTLDLPADDTVSVTCTLPETVSSSNKQQNIEGDLIVTINDQLVYNKRIMVKIKAETNFIDKIANFFNKA